MTKLHTTIYRDHELVARREPAGWRVRITDTERKTRIHPHPFAAFAEARAQVDSFLNQGARLSIWPGFSGGRRGRRIRPALRRLQGWFRAALLGGEHRA
jgi:hypothetical protein